MGNRIFQTSTSHLPRNREDVVSLAKQPRERQLGGGPPPFSRHRLQLLDHSHVLGEILRREARVVASDVVGFEVGWARDSAAEEAAREGRVGYDGDAELPTCGEEVGLGVFDVGCEWTVFDLGRYLS